MSAVSVWKSLDSVCLGFVDGRKFEELLKPKDVAKIFNITTKRLWEWQKKGIIKAVKLPTGKLRYPKSEVERLWKQLKASGFQ